jgi:3-hydroxybutyryl-CoA dehydrogenase
MSETTNSIENVLVVGAGTMGHGIVQVAATAGCRVGLADVTEDVLATAVGKIRGHLERMVEKGRLESGAVPRILERIVTNTDPLALADQADLVIEAIPEDLELKRELFARLDARAKPAAILATNTSSLPVSEIAAATKRPGQVLGAHFFNPVPVMALLELVRGEETSDATVAAVRAAGERFGKTVIVVKDSPGFATSRLGVILGLEAIRMLEQGVASAEDIDRAMELGYRHPMGPLRLTDLVGLDVRLKIAEHLHEKLGGAQYEPPALLREMVAAGRLGKKSGEGFYRW